MWFFFFLSLCSFAAEPRGITQISRDPEIDFGDPSAPDTSEPGIVRVYATGGEVLEWRDTKSKTAMQKLLDGDKPKHSRLSLLHADGTPFDAEGAGEDAWDPTIYQGVLYAGVMSPTDGRSTALWPDDHWNRRTHAFTRSGDAWRVTDSLFSVPEVPTWIGHNYGHDFLRTEDGREFLFYERVTAEKDGQPWKTELFAREMNGAFVLRDKEIPVFTFKKSWPAARRGFGGLLAEGARPFFASGKILVAFSAGDYTSDNYGIHLLWADRVEGPYHPYLTRDGKDLKDFGTAIEAEIPLTWGAARPAFFQAEGGWWVLFHGIDKRLGPVPADGKRAIYLAPVKINGRPDGPPEVLINGKAE